MKTNNITQKIKNLTPHKQVYFFLCLVIVFVSLYYMTTINRIDTIQYKRPYSDVVLCEETYINGVLNTTPCPQNSKYYFNDNVNITLDNNLTLLYIK